MAITYASVTLRFWLPGGKVAYEDFVPPLRTAKPDPYGKLGAEEDRRDTGLVMFGEVRIERHESAPDPWGAFAGALTRLFDDTAQWLRERPAAVFEDFRRRGFRVDLLVEMWIEGDQMDLTLPPSICRACGENGIGMILISNE
jgi:hypothetical protein